MNVNRIGRVAVVIVLVLAGAGPGCDDASPAATSPTGRASSTTVLPSSRGPKPSLVPPASKDSDVQREVRAAFVDYQTVLRNKDGAAAAARLDAGTIEAYRGYIIQAQHLKRPELDALGLVALVNVLRLRHELSPDELARATATEIFARSVREGWTSDRALLDAKVGRISVHGDRANISPAKTPFSPAFYFKREDDGWRYDLIEGQKRLGATLGSLMGASGAKDRLTFAAQLIAKASAKQPFDPSHLEGPPPGMPAPPPGSEALLAPEKDEGHGHAHGDGHDHGGAPPPPRPRAHGHDDDHDHAHD
ncbi:MAG: hypothetical protein AAGN82_00555 [Myxococcota bacterium]